MFTLDALNTRKSATTKHAPCIAVFGQKLNNLNNIDFRDLNCAMEESVESLLPEIDTVQSKVPSDNNENNPSDITSNSHNYNEHKPKPKPASQKFCKSTKPVQRPLGHIEKPIPKLHLKPSQTDDLPSVPTDFQTTSSRKDGSNQTNFNFSDLLQDKINIKESTSWKDIQPIEENEDLNENHQSEEESEDEVERVDIDLDRLEEF